MPSTHSTSPILKPKANTHARSFIPAKMVKYVLKQQQAASVRCQQLINRSKFLFFTHTRQRYRDAFLPCTANFGTPVVATKCCRTDTTVPIALMQGGKLTDSILLLLLPRENKRGPGRCLLQLQIQPGAPAGFARCTDPQVAP